MLIATVTPVFLEEKLVVLKIRHYFLYLFDHYDGKMAFLYNSKISELLFFLFIMSLNILVTLRKEENQLSIFSQQFYYLLAITGDLIGPKCP